MSQLALCTEPELTFEVYDLWGRHIASIPVIDGNWNQAEKWAYLAHCRAMRELPPPTWARFPG